MRWQSKRTFAPASLEVPPPALTQQSMVTSSSPCFSTGYNNQAWGVDSHPLGGFLNLLKKNTPSGAQVVINGSSSQSINVGDDTNVAIAEDLFASILINAF
ncbi:hypothetical protein DAI22_07g220100 [Oryza sativa Japonica Group]|uniref:Uncharacterized protein n=1 Tax=Oryza sativa subsp. japonica TaxID=39947 RepID=Q6YVY4_ORYSJ|nr:hypothetical protein DAI22_07g220100 [Oryza sativa Japonica Group]BAC84473.1 hypothetical protein [Oryza sativa Japonica Group]BAD31714.1 hypothetical protein [Oryza sativa Japonica Group]